MYGNLTVIIVVCLNIISLRSFLAAIFLKSLKYIGGGCCFVHLHEGVPATYELSKVCHDGGRIDLLSGHVLKSFF